jgi:hypothetical protein
MFFFLLSRFVSYLFFSCCYYLISFYISKDLIGADALNLSYINSEIHIFAVFLLLA